MVPFNPLTLIYLLEHIYKQIRPRLSFASIDLFVKVNTLILLHVNLRFKQNFDTVKSNILSMAQHKTIFQIPNYVKVME